MMRTKKATLLLPTILASVWVVKAQITIEEDDVFFDCSADQYFDTT